MSTAVATADPGERPADVAERGPLLSRIVVALPDRLLMAFLWCAVVVAVCVLAGQFRRALVLPLCVVAVVALWRVRPARLPGDARSALGSAVALELAAGWVLLNRPYRAELLSVARDPSIYTLRGWWLWHHASPNIPIGSARPFEQFQGAVVGTGGFPEQGAFLHPQGNSLVPGLLGVAAWLHGESGLLDANLVIGALALLAVYAFARRVVGPLWGLVPMVALGASMPMVYFARAPFTEPTALLVTFLGATLLWSAVRTGSRLQFAAAGVAVGAAQLARIDGAVTVLGVSFGLGLVAVLALDPQRRRRARVDLLVFAVAAGVLLGLGTLDLLLNSPTYLSSQRGSLVPLLAGVVVVVVVMLVLGVVPLGALRTAVARRRRLLAPVAAVLVLGAVAVMISRPLWWTGRFNDEPLIERAIGGLQRAAGQPVDGTRSYDEQTMRWLSWYLGWPTVLVAGVGLAAVAWVVLRRRDARVVVPFAGFAAVSILYLNDVSITPDQIWAMRRMLPVILPGVLVLATVVAVGLARWRPSLAWLGGAVAAGVAFSPLVSWNSLVTVPEESGERAETVAICQALGSSHVVVTGLIPVSGYYLPTARVVCGDETVYLKTATASTLAALQSRWGGAPLSVLTFTPDSVPWTTAPTTPVHVGQYPTWQQSLVSRPAAANDETRRVYVGTVGADGRVTPRG